jgi:hypothetical protein
MTAAVSLLALAACDKPATETKSDDPSAKNITTTTQGTAATTAVPTAATATATATAQPAVAMISDSDLSTPADFEEVAEKAITAKSYKAELQTLEADLAKD